MVERHWPLRGSADAVSVYVQRLGERLVVASELRESRGVFSVVRNLEPIAFAVGGGRFVVSDGALGFLNDQDQLAAVLAHEIAHEDLGHFCTPRKSRARTLEFGPLTQDFDLATEIAADRRAVVLLKAAGFEGGAMRGVLRCLLQVPGAGRSELSARIDALGGGDTRPLEPLETGSVGFRELQQGVREELGAGAMRCR